MTNRLRVNTTGIIINYRLNRIREAWYPVAHVMRVVLRQFEPVKHIDQNCTSRQDSQSQPTGNGLFLWPARRSLKHDSFSSIHPLISLTGIWPTRSLALCRPASHLSPLRQWLNTGCVQRNIGVELRVYGSLAAWFPCVFLIIGRSPYSFFRIKNVAQLTRHEIAVNSRAIGVGIHALVVYDSNKTSVSWRILTSLKRLIDTLYYLQSDTPA